MANPPLKRLIPLFLLLSSFFLALALSELVTRRAFFTPSERREGAARLWVSYENSYLRTVEAETGCIFSDTIVAHPFLSYVGRNNPECRTNSPNNWGVISFYDMPKERDPDFFTVLLVGGSVALNFYQTGGAPPLLQQELNNRYVSPNGKPFRLMGGSVGGWALPQQYIYASLFGGNTNAIIELDGYNEATNVSYNHSLDEPNFSLYELAAQPAWATQSLRRIQFLQSVRRYAFQIPLAKDSFLLFLSWRQLIPPSTGNLAETPLKAVADSFTLPMAWTPAKKMGWNKERYKTYVLLMDSLSRTLGLKYAHFLQPMLSLGKPMSEDEKKFNVYVSPELYRDVFVEASRELRATGIPSVSLGGVFKNYPQTIYSDQVHVSVAGNHIMASAIAKELGALWKLKRKQ